MSVGSKALMTVGASTGDPISATTGSLMYGGSFLHMPTILKMPDSKKDLKKLLIRAKKNPSSLTESEKVKVNKSISYLNKLKKSNNE
jgi:hypothetical protein